MAHKQSQTRSSSRIGLKLLRPKQKRCPSEEGQALRRSFLSVLGWHWPAVCSAEQVFFPLNLIIIRLNVLAWLRLAQVGLFFTMVELAKSGRL